MTSTTVSNVLPQAAPAAANTKDTNKVTEDQGVSFQNLLGSPSGKGAKNIAAQANLQPNTKSDAGSGVKQADTSAIGNKRDAVKIEDGTKPKELTKEQKETAESATSDFEEKVTDALTEELDISDEELAEAMETLGLTFLDLAQPDNLIALVQEVTGTEESIDLLTNPSLNGVMDQVSELVTNLTEEAGIPLEELTALGMTENDEAVPAEFEIPTEPVAVNEEQTTAQTFAPNQTVETAESLPEETVVETAAEIEPELTVRSGEETERPQTAEPRPEEAEPESESIRTEVASSEAKTETRDDGAETQTGSDKGFTGTSEQSKTNAAETPTEHAAPVQHHEAPEQIADIPEQMPEARPVVDVQELLDQFAEFARTNVTTDTTSIEMRLNPENLGRLLINVQEQEGAVKATIQTQNAEVKEALETQIAVLRTTLEGQGLKVTEVEVTVASHEFEENLEKGNTENMTGDDRGERREAEESGGTTGRRNLNLNDLDSLQGLMSEEEALAAQIMRDNGNTMDYKA